MLSTLSSCSSPAELTGSRCQSDDDCQSGQCSNGRCVASEDAAVDFGDTQLANDASADAPGFDVQPIDVGETDVPQLGEFGDPCDYDAQCISRYCIDTNDGRMCTQLCLETCPEGFDCVLLTNLGADAVRICVPESDVLCRPCEVDSDCGDFSSYCLEQDNGLFCAVDCSVDRNCPEHYGCNQVTIEGAGPQGEDIETHLCEPLLGACYDCLNDFEEGFDLSNSPEHCGECDNPCYPETNEIANCVDGACNRVCQAGYYNYNPEVEGCEYPCTINELTGGTEICNFNDDDCSGSADEIFDIENDVNYCGDCLPCALDNSATHECVRGECRAVDCEAGWGDCNDSFSDGCERNIWANSACGLTCETPTDCTALDSVETVHCEAGACVIDDCLDGFEHCDSSTSNGCEVDLSDPATCGTSCVDFDVCFFPNAEATCTDGDCEMGLCDDDYYNIDPDDPEDPDDDGCEYGPCEFVAGIDIPNRVVHNEGTLDEWIEFVDSDCDGIDGDIGHAIFVSVDTGSDTSPNCSMDAPCASIERGITFAQLWSRTQILVADGTYQSVDEGGANIPLEVPDGIGIYGGYDLNWIRADRSDTSHQVRIHGGFHSDDNQYMAVRGYYDTAIVANVVIVAPNAYNRDEGYGRSSYGVHAYQSDLTFEYVTVEQGNGYSGAGGTPGTSADTSEDLAINGGAGDPSIQAYVSCGLNNGGNGGGAGTNGRCSGDSTRGGAGGKGGAMDTSESCFLGVCVCSYNSTNGSPGSSAGVTDDDHGNGGSLGPRSESSNHTAYGGGDGDPGNHGDDGDGGTGGTVGGEILNGRWWAGQEGGDGYMGAHGSGGGGGGGGGGCDHGSVGTFDQTGGGGGGGGAGGCRAISAGSRAYGGGGSFGIFGVHSDLDITHCQFQRGDGGDGGVGGTGGSGQSGGNIGGGGTGPGPHGGDGGSGGNGGHSGGGGGGGGGISYGIYSYNSTVTESDNLSSGGSAGAAGNGGWSPGNDGFAGAPGSLGGVGTCASSSECGDPEPD